MSKMLVLLPQYVYFILLIIDNREILYLRLYTRNVLNTIRRHFSLNFRRHSKGPISSPVIPFTFAFMGTREHLPNTRGGAQYKGGVVDFAVKE